MDLACDFDDLLEDLRLGLVEWRLEPTQPPVAEVGETVGALCALADRRVLGRAVTTVQRVLNVVDDPAIETVLLALRSSLASAGSARESVKSQLAEVSQGGSVRERVLGALMQTSGARTTDVAAQLEISVPQASRALNELAKAGAAVATVPEGADRRTRVWVASRSARRDTAPFACISDAIRAMTPQSGNFRSDMLPVGPADRVDDAAVANMSRRLAASLDKGSYKPVLAKQFRVAKDGDTSRPAALMRLPDRLVYSALAHAACGALGESLKESTLWPRAETGQPRWSEFESAPLNCEADFVVVADVASFYDTVDHSLLRDSLAERGGDPEVLQTLQTFLGTVMGGTVGLPQGLPASDPLATFALAPIDDALSAAGFTHFRHGDDFRIMAESRHHAREAIAFLGGQLRLHRLHLSSLKTFPIPIASYRENVVERETKWLQKVRIATGFETEQGIVGTAEGFDPGADGALDDLGRLDDLEPHLKEIFSPPVADTGMRISLGRYGEVEDIWIEEPDRELPEHSPELVATIERATEGLAIAADGLLTAGANAWEVKLYRDLFAGSLGVLSLVGEPFGDTAWWVSFLQERPQDTRIAARYLGHLAYHGRTELPVGVAQEVVGGPFSDWQAAWTIAAAACAGEGAAPLAATLSTHLDGVGWLAKLASANLLQRLDALSSTQLHGLWVDAPLALRADLAVLLARAEQTSDVARALNVEADVLERVLAEPVLA